MSRQRLDPRIADIVKTLAVCASIDLTRHALNGVFFDGARKAWVSSDGRRLFVSRTLPHPPTPGVYKVDPFKGALDFVPLPLPEGMQFPDYEAILVSTPVGPDTARFHIPKWCARFRPGDEVFFALSPDPVRLDTRLQGAGYRINLANLAPLAGEQVYLHWRARSNMDVAYLTPGPVKDLWEHPWWMAVTSAHEPARTWFVLEDVKR